MIRPSIDILINRKYLMVGLDWMFQEGKLAILGFNRCFLSVHPDTDAIIATSRKAGPGEYVQLRCQVERNLKKDDRPVEEQSANIRQIEINYV